jgi:hypothetical protein
LRAPVFRAAVFRAAVFRVPVLRVVALRALVLLELVFRALAFRPAPFRAAAFRAAAFRAPLVLRSAAALFLREAPAWRDAVDRERVLPARLREAEGDLRAAGFLAICVCPSGSLLPRLTVRP